MKIAIITGGSSGIGRAAALSLARRGVGTLFTFHSNEAWARSAAEEIERAGGAAAALKLDVSQVATFDAFVTETRRVLRERFRRDDFDFLVNNAGIGGGKPFEDVTEAQLDRLFDTNFKGPFFLTQKLLPLLVDGGHIVNVSSNSTRIISPGYSAYGASKAALTVVTKYWAKELARRQIRVNSVSPGPVLTNLSDGIERGAMAKHPEYLEPLAAQTALGRIGQPDDVGAAIAALLSDDNRWVTGVDLEVSGGFML